MKCKPYSEITVENGTHLKTVKITLNIFAVYCLYFIAKMNLGNSASKMEKDRRKSYSLSL